MKNTYNTILINGVDFYYSEFHPNYNKIFRIIAKYWLTELDFGLIYSNLVTSCFIYYNIFASWNLDQSVWRLIVVELNL